MAVFGVTVGKKPTAAQSYLDDPAAVMEVSGRCALLLLHLVATTAPVASAASAVLPFLLPQQLLIVDDCCH
jgi:hypothetical protein